MGFVVKNTTKCGLFDLVCPHFCRGCGELGELLCERCKNDILEKNVNHCPKCGKLISSFCSECKMDFSATFVIGYRDELIGALAEEYKFFGVRGMENVFADLLDNFLPDLAEDVSIVPLPTIQKHIRERGLDHTFSVAKALAKKRGWRVERLLIRKNDSVQLGATKKKRKEQAAEAYEFSGQIRPERAYIVFDDIWTTGASMEAAGAILKENGAKKLVAILLATNRKGKKPIIRH